MKWKTYKNVKTASPSTFLVLPLVEVINKQQSTMPKNPGLRLFTKTYSSKSKEIYDQSNTRALTATLDKPQILDIRFITKIDMSLVRKEFLTIANLCRAPITTAKVRRKPSVLNQKRNTYKPVKFAYNKPVLKFTNKMSSSKSDENQNSVTETTTSVTRTNKTPQLTTQQTSTMQKHTKNMKNDGNNNCATYRVSRKKIDRTTTKLPQPCNTCGRADVPERFHSHPEKAPLKKQEKTEKKSVAVVKNVVQKPVPINYKPKLTKGSKTSPVLKMQSTPTVGKEVPNTRVLSAKGPRTLCCYVCGREFGTMSLPLHEPKCLEKWHRENASLPSPLRRELPVKPDHTLTKTEYNNFAWEASQANLVPCKNCGRTFYPDRLGVHQRSCKPSQLYTMSRTPGRNNGPVQEAPTQEIEAQSHVAPPKGVHCSVCGRMFGTKSIKFHEPQCLKKWHMLNDNLPKSEREPMYSELEKAAVNKPVEPVKSPERESSEKRPPMFPCYLCGRLFSVKSIYIHEPQCLKKWHAENEKLPPSKRKAEPLKPDVKFTRDGKADYGAMAEANWRCHLQQLVPCKNCGRTFAPDRVCVDEKSCRAPNRKFNQNIKVEIF